MAVYKYIHVWEFDVKQFPFGQCHFLLMVTGKSLRALFILFSFDLHQCTPDTLSLLSEEIMYFYSYTTSKRKVSKDFQNFLACSNSDSLDFCRIFDNVFVNLVLLFCSRADESCHNHDSFIILLSTYQMDYDVLK